ncbi:unnamed protein product [Closterium sp. NIES-54]
MSPLSLSPTPFSDALRAACPVVSRVLSPLVTHPTAPPSSISALISAISVIAASHHLDYASQLVSGLARSPSFGGAPIFHLEVLEDRLFELEFLAVDVPHLCAMLLGIQTLLTSRSLALMRRRSWGLGPCTG